MAPQQPPTRSSGRGRSGRAAGSPSHGPRVWPWIAGGIAVAVLAVAAFALLSGASGGSRGTLVRSSNGAWTNISADTLASELTHKDFTLLNVKTPYIGEIQGTDLYIPYTQLAARAGELPADKGARIVVYCRSGNESAIAAQTLLDLGYTDIQNLDRGMNAWSASGRTLVNLGRS